MEQCEGIGVLPDLIDKKLKVLFCGIAPGVKSSKHGHHFAAKGDRFWQTLHLAGYTPIQLRAEQGSTLLEFGYGVSQRMIRPRVSVAELTEDEFRRESALLTAQLERYTPAYIAFMGKVAYLSITRLKTVEWGLQLNPIAGAIVWVLPTPSGPNRAFDHDQMVSAYRDLRLASEAHERRGSDASGARWQSRVIRGPAGRIVSRPEAANSGEVGVDLESPPSGIGAEG